MTIACQFIIYIDTDPLDDPSTISDANAILRQATAQARSQQFNFNKAKNISLCIRKDDQLYYTGADKQNLRFSNQGTAYVIQVTDVLDFNGAVLSNSISSGSIYLDWNVCFDVPQINPSALVLSSWVNSVPSSYVRQDVISGGSSTLGSVSTSVSASPNQAYVVTYDYGSFSCTASSNVLLSVDVSTSLPNPSVPVADGWGTSHATFAQGLIFTGPDGTINLALSAANDIDPATTTGVATLLFTPVSF
jgi:hypothetical protein